VKVAFVSDFFDNQLLGGAELNDGVLIKHLQKKFSVKSIKSTECKKSDLEGSDFVIVSNFVGLHPELRQFIVSNKPYIIYEHDHKYVSNRDPSKFKDFVIPQEYLVNQDFYAQAKKVICLSSSQVDIIEKNLKISNLENISCSLWSAERLDLLEGLSETVKNDKFAIMNSSNPIKNTKLAQQVCVKNNLKYDLIKSDDQIEFLKILSSYKGLVFIPGVLESLSRLVTEAKMMNCKILTTPKMLGAAYEDWFGLSGKDLISVIRENVNSALDLFEREVLS